MACFDVAISDSIATVTMSRGKVNAINPEFVSELQEILNQLEYDDRVGAVVLAGNGKFFSFGLDIPEVYDYTPEAMTRFIQSFCDLYYRMFLFPKPVIGMLNGHAMAGGCILALVCDRRIMTEGRGKVALNEVTFGASLFAGAVGMLRYACGNRNAEKVLLTGAMFGPEESLQLGLVDEISPEASVVARAREVAADLSRHVGAHFASLKRLARQPVADGWRLRESVTIREWIDIWYSPETRAKAKSIQIR